MFSGLTSWLGFSDELPAQAATRPQISPVAPGLAGSIAQHAVKYNAKVVLRGSRATGKSALLQRLQGLPVSATYAPSGAIAAAAIPYRHRQQHRAASTITSDVKIEVWDVVDQGFAQRAGSSTSGSIKGAPQHLPAMPTDATTVDVYTLCTCAVFLFDISRRETFEYVVAETKKVPPDILIVICSNFCDQEETRAVSRDEVAELVLSLRRTSTHLVSTLCRGIPDNGLSFPAVAIDMCLVTDFGMRPLHSYFGLIVQYAKIAEAERRLKKQYEEALEQLEELREIQERHCVSAGENDAAKMAALIAGARPSSAPSGRAGIHATTATAALVASTALLPRGAPSLSGGARVDSAGRHRSSFNGYHNEGREGKLEEGAAAGVAVLVSRPLPELDGRHDYGHFFADCEPDIEDTEAPATATSGAASEGGAAALGGSAHAATDAAAMVPLTRGPLRSVARTSTEGPAQTIPTATRATPKQQSLPVDAAVLEEVRRVARTMAETLDDTSETCVIEEGSQEHQCESKPSQETARCSEHDETPAGAVAMATVASELPAATSSVSAEVGVPLTEPELLEL